MTTINIQYYQTVIGELILGSFDGQLCMLDYKNRKMRETVDRRIKNGLKAEFKTQNDDVLDKTKAQLEEYLTGIRKTFDIPLLMVGSEFQQRVWNALLAVPYGETSTYRELSEAISNVKAVRAVAGANGANAMSVIVPCHRIIGSDGKLVGYAGGLPAKKHLLKLEGALNDSAVQSAQDDFDFK